MCLWVRMWWAFASAMMCLGVRVCASHVQRRVRVRVRACIRAHKGVHVALPRNASRLCWGAALGDKCCWEAPEVAVWHKR